MLPTPALCSNFAACPACQARIARAGTRDQITADGVCGVPAGSRLVKFDQAREEIQDGDILLWRPTSLLGRLIARGTGSVYSHASMAAGLCDGLANLEMLQWRGGCVSNLAKQVQRWPGSCDVFRPRPSYDARHAVDQMFRLVQQDYGWADFVFILGYRYLRLPLPCRRDTYDPEQPRVCSAAVAWAIRTGAGLRVDERACDAEIVPGDLANPEFSNYVLTLIP